MSVLFQMFGIFSTCIWSAIWMNVVQVPPISGCKLCNSKVEREKRLITVQGQILAKLGLKMPPDESETVWNVSRQVLQTYKSAVREKDKLLLETKICRSQIDTEEFFAKRVERILLEKEVARTAVSSSKDRNVKDIYWLRFNTSRLVKEKVSVSLAELRVYQTPNQRHPVSDVRIDVCENTRKYDKNNIHGCSAVLSTKWSVSTEEKWISFDVTSVVQGWLDDSETNHGLTVTVTSSLPTGNDWHVSPIYLGDVDPVLNNAESEDDEPWPHILAWFVPNERVQSTKRKRRSLNSDYCRIRPKETRCCLRSLYVDFRKDLRWNWIHAPQGFYPNYCAGQCSFMWGVEKKNHHTSIMTLYNKIKPSAPGDPCCVPKTYEPLVILYFKDGEPKIEELSNMVVNECICL